MPVVEHKPWVLCNMPIPPGIYKDVCKIIQTKIDAGVYECSNSSYRSRWFTNGFFILLLSCSWWGAAVSDLEEENKEFFLSTFEDLEFVLETMNASMDDMPSSSKHTHEKDDNIKLNKSFKRRR